MTPYWWTPFVVAGGSLLLQGIVAWVVLQFIREEQDRHRMRLHEHAQMLTKHEATIDDHERELERIRDDLDSVRFGPRRR